mmetsp:Transcript_21892/g.67384  ORF Transcript_21892/g.67384 Transcript_21892/m.67384 type:complete len:273 (+) Transcript_21892:964-1782(+)
MFARSDPLRSSPMFSSKMHIRIVSYPAPPALPLPFFPPPDAAVFDSVPSFPEPPAPSSWLCPRLPPPKVAEMTEPTPPLLPLLEAVFLEAISASWEAMMVWMRWVESAKLTRRWLGKAMDNLAWTTWRTTAESSKWQIVMGGSVYSSAVTGGFLGLRNMCIVMLRARDGFEPPEADDGRDGRWLPLLPLVPRSTTGCRPPAWERPFCDDDDDAPLASTAMDMRASRRCGAGASPFLSPTTSGPEAELRKSSSAMVKRRISSLPGSSGDSVTK